jgi:hypothetical protein
VNFWNHDRQTRCLLRTSIYSGAIELVEADSARKRRNLSSSPPRHSPCCHGLGRDSRDRRKQRLHIQHSPYQHSLEHAARLSIGFAQAANGECVHHAQALLKPLVRRSDEDLELGLVLTLCAEAMFCFRWCRSGVAWLELQMRFVIKIYKQLPLESLDSFLVGVMLWVYGSPSGLGVNVSSAAFPSISEPYLLKMFLVRGRNLGSLV